MQVLIFSIALITAYMVLGRLKDSPARMARQLTRRCHCRLLFVLASVLINSQ